jgi:glutathione S-transferase
MITVHHLNNSRSQRVLWLLEELGLDYEVKRYQRDRQTMLAPPELRAVHPLGKSPVITDDSVSGGLTLAESGAIVEHLADRYGAGKLAPAFGSAERVRYLYWLHFAEGTAQPPLLLKLLFDRIRTKSPLLVRPIARAIADKALTTFVLPQPRFHGKRAGEERMVCRRAVQRCRHPDELSARGVAGARRAGRETPAIDGLP